jgi:predicted transcriptional regulator
MTETLSIRLDTQTKKRLDISETSKTVEVFLAAEAVARTSKPKSGNLEKSRRVWRISTTLVP